MQRAAGDAADFQQSADARPVKSDIANIRILHGAEQAHAIGAWFVDLQMVDGMAVAVE